MKVYCVDGPCKGQIYSAFTDAVIMNIVTPENPFHESARYAITKQITRLGERIAIVTSVQKRKNESILYRWPV